MRPLVFAACFAALAGLAGCSGSSDSAAAGAGGVGSAALGGGAGGIADVTSVQYFQVQVGDRVFFLTDQTDLTPDARAVLDRQAEWLNQQSAMRIRIEGHADERGTREYNLALGARRASTVAAYLASRGIDPRRIETVSYGRERPVEVCSDDPCWSKNRRAVTVPN